MNDESSVFGAKPDHLDRLLRFALEPPEAEEYEPAPASSLDSLTEKPGGRIDHYRLLQVLGEGGMGIVYLAQQEEPVRRQVALKVIKLKLGNDHPDTLESLNDIGAMYLKQGRYDEAENRLLEAYKGRASKLGPEHPMALKSLNNLVDLYEAWNKPERAKQWRAKLPES
jgi:serine/threonine protein kinase